MSLLTTVDIHESLAMVGNWDENAQGVTKINSMWSIAEAFVQILSTVSSSSSD